MPLSTTYLFGGDMPWSPLDWTSSDDTVRGGKSFSEFTIVPSSPTARFQGNLDIKTLGGAGFASQRTTGEDRIWDLSKFDGLILDIKEGDDKHYTITLKDQLLPQSPDGRDQSTISWEYEFLVPAGGEKLKVRWADLKPTYRGREKDDAAPIDLKNIKRFSLMMRSFFGKQEGDFSMSITSISVMRCANESIPGQDQNDPNEKGTTGHRKKSEGTASCDTQQSWLSWLSSSCVVS